MSHVNLAEIERYLSTFLGNLKSFTVNRKLSSKRIFISTSGFSAWNCMDIVLLAAVLYSIIVLVMLCVQKLKEIINGQMNTKRVQNLLIGSFGTKRNGLKISSPYR